MKKKNDKQPRKATSPKKTSRSSRIGQKRKVVRRQDKSKLLAYKSTLKGEDAVQATVEAYLARVIEPKHGKTVTFRGETVTKLCRQGQYYSGAFTSKGSANKAKMLGHQKGRPDFDINCPRGAYCGLFIELKDDENSPWRKTDGELVSNKHTNYQYIYQLLLREEGHYATFAVGVDMAIFIIDSYFALKPGETLPYYTDQTWNQRNSR